MRILHLSDTHSKHNLLKNLPNADVVVHSGDVSFAGSENEVLDFLNWFCDWDYSHKIFVAGNYDDYLYYEQIEGLPIGILDFDDNINYGCHYLLKAVERINPRYHLFGHIHAANGIKKIKQTTFVNSAIMNEKYEFINKPTLLEI